MKYLFRSIAIYILVLLVFTLTYIMLFHTPLFTEQKVLFYRGLLLLLPATIITNIVLAFISRYWFKIKNEILIAAVLISISMNLSFFILSPVSIDRSVTIFLLTKLKDACTNTTCYALSESTLENYILKDYLKK